MQRRITVLLGQRPYGYVAATARAAAVLTAAAAHVTLADVFLVASNVLAANGALAVTERTLVIGRDSACDLRLHGVGISRRHCAVWRDRSGTCWLMDLHSRNGTFVDGRSVLFAAVSPGSQIQLGCPPQASLVVTRERPLID